MSTGGQLIALEGPKGVGKTTLAAALSRRLAVWLAEPPSPPVALMSAFRPPPPRVLVTKEPTPAFNLGNETHLRGRALAEAIVEDRRRHVDEEIGPALDAGGVVICDRYILSSYAFHCADGVPAEVIDELNKGFPLPALNLILQVSPQELARRRGSRRTATRLQDSDQLGAYLTHAGRMSSRGVPFEVVDNATMTDLDHLAEHLATVCALTARTAS